MEPVNLRESVSRNGWRRGQHKLIKLGELVEFRAIEYGTPTDRTPTGLERALDHVHRFEVFSAGERIAWIHFRKGVEEWPDRQNHPGLEQAYQAVADMPETLTNEGVLWEELRFQAERVLAG